MSDTDSQPPKKVFDIRRPGKAPASPTSRPVIVGHKPEMKDEMIGGTTSKMGSKEQRPLLSALAKVTIQPVPQPEVPAPSVPVEPSNDLAVSSSVKLPAEPTDRTQPKPLSDKLLAAAAEVPENPNPMTQNGDNVYVSHHKNRLTFGNVLLIILLIMVLTAAAVNFLLDADVIKTDMNIMHTNWL